MSDLQELVERGPEGALYWCGTSTKKGRVWLTLEQVKARGWVNDIKKVRYRRHEGTPVTPNRKR
jgi:hypothetical protein